MMQLGFVSAILPDLNLEETLRFAEEASFDCVELMCWPAGKAERRYAGVTHIDCGAFKKGDVARVKELVEETGVDISGLGYYPNPLAADAAESRTYVEHLKKVIKTASLLGVGVVNTFVGRDPVKSVDENWPRFLKIWKPLIEFAEGNGVKIGIENCPMSFTRDEWPGGKNLATSPAIWRRMFSDIPSKSFGLNFDPSHFVWQQMDYVGVLREFQEKLFHMHAKDARVDWERLNEVGLLAFPSQYHTPKLPGLGDVDWGEFMGTLCEVYDGPICIEVEDRAYEGDLEKREAALVQSARYLCQFMP